MEGLPWYFPFLALCLASVELVFESCIYLNGFSYFVTLCEAKNNNLGNKMEFVGWWWHLVGVLILGFCFCFFNIFIRGLTRIGDYEKPRRWQTFYVHTLCSCQELSLTWGHLSFIRCFKMLLLLRTAYCFGFNGITFFACTLQRKMCLHYLKPLVHLKHSIVYKKRDMLIDLLLHLVIFTSSF